jgi:hypothetical protein
MALVSCDFKEIILLIERFKLPMLIAAVALLILFTTTQVFANMFGFFSKEEFELSAPVEGHLLYEEQPVAGKKVFRKLNYGDDYIDEVTTGTDGRFSFPEKVIKTSKPSNMFDNESVIQHIYTLDENAEEVTIWAVRVFPYEHKDTLTEYLNDLVCDIAHEPQTYDIAAKEDKQHTFAVFTTCKL